MPQSRGVTPGPAPTHRLDAEHNAQGASPDYAGVRPDSKVASSGVGAEAVVEDDIAR
jgi:hypothetical protein